MISRKDFLKTGALSGLALPFGAGVSAASGTGSAPLTSAGRPSKEGDAKNVIFLVADGMSIGALTMGDIVKRRQYGSASNWISLYGSDRVFFRGLMDMASADSFVTDSAAAASSWGCGHRIKNGGVNWGLNGERHKPVTRIFREAGKATGLVTTTRITHATPAGFAANVPNRDMEDQIAEQYLETGIDLFLGGGDRHFSPTARKDGRDLYREFSEKGYAVVKDKAALSKAPESGRLLGIFSRSHLPYTVDRKTVPQLTDTVPTLAEMTQAALRRLEGAPNGFLLQIEGGRVDHAAHGNDPAGLVYDMIEFDDAVGVVLDYISGREDTLVIITTDHSNANVGVNGAGLGYTGSPAMLDQISRFRHSNEWMQENLPKEPTVKQLQDLIEQATTLQITDREAEMLQHSLKGTFETPYRAERTAQSVLAKIQANYLSINWLGQVHTSDYVEIAVLGPGMDRLTPFVRNTQLFDLMVDMAGVRAHAEH